MKNKKKYQKEVEALMEKYAKRLSDICIRQMINYSQEVWNVSRKYFGEKK